MQTKTFTFTSLRSAVSLVVLLAVFTGLLSAHGVAAQDVPPGTINLTREQVNGIVYDNWLMNLSYKNNTALSRERTILSLLVSNQLFSDMALYDPDVIIKQANALQERYIQRLGPNGADETYRANLPPRIIAQTMFTAALENPVFKDSAREVYRQLRDEMPKRGGPTDERLEAYYRTFTEGNVFADASATLLDEKIEQATKRANDKQFVKAWDAVFAPYTGVKLEDFAKGDFDIKAFFASHPEAGIPQELQDDIKPDGSLDISLADLERLAMSEFGKINASIDDMQQTLVIISKQQGELVDFMKDQQKRQQAQALAEAKAKEHQLKLQAASSAVSIVSTLVGLKYPERGKQIAVVGQSLIKVGDSLTGYVKTVAGMSTLGASLSTVVLTGNVLGAVMNIVSLFGPQQPTPEQTILEEIGKLRQQVSELRTEMHTRFDQVDKELNTIYTTMQQRFNQIDIQLGKITTSLAEIQESLLGLGIALNRMERNNVEYFDALGRRPLREAMNGALGYKERTGLDMPYQPDYVNYENIFHTWGTVNAFDALSAGPTQRDYSDGQVLAELSAAPLDANLNYLNGWLVAHGMQPFATKRLPSPRDWAFASRAYAQLGFDWPAHLKRISVQRQAALDAVGNDVQQALQNISTIQTASGPQGNAPLFTGLNAYYSDKLKALDSALRGSEVAYASEVQTALNRPTPFELYGGLDQALAYQPADFKTVTCGGTYDLPLTTPFNLKNAVSAYNRFALADYLQLKPLKVCFGVEYIEISNECFPTPANCELYGKLKVALAVISDQVVLMRSEVVGSRQKVIQPLEALKRDWLFYKVRFEAMFGAATQPIPLTPEGTQQLNTVSSALTSKLAELQHVHSGRVLNGLNTGPLRGKAVELAGAKKLLESFITLGFPQAIASDDFVRSLLLSQESLVDDQQIVAAYAKPASATQSAAQAINAEQLLTNPRIKLLQMGQKRDDALAKVLTGYLGGISTETYREDNPLIGGARFDMVLARAFAAPPGQRRLVFLPLLQR